MDWPRCREGGGLLAIIGAQREAGKPAMVLIAPTRALRRQRLSPSKPINKSVFGRREP
ncbi:hypothetical protein X741_15130 [Mesorhizobium sp. LNHC229A00]|nr:hypothetical protein X741_15130 [Mesorhizobium sp. LNHC229A00]